jgi:hypothetical protein
LGTRNHQRREEVILSEAKDQFGPFVGERAELILRFAQDDGLVIRESLAIQGTFPRNQ